jgi:hypothetical protein
MAATPAKNPPHGTCRLEILLPVVVGVAVPLVPISPAASSSSTIVIRGPSRARPACLVMRRPLAGGAGVVEGATTADGATVEDIGRELMNISNFERGRIGGEPDPTAKQSILGN